MIDDDLVERMKIVIGIEQHFRSRIEMTIIRKSYRTSLDHITQLSQFLAFLILHPGPMNKGWEISPFTAYGKNSAIQEEVQNGVAVRMALFTLVLTGGKQE